MITSQRKKFHVRSLWLLPVLAMLPLAGSARADDDGGASAGVTVTAKIATCQPVITTTEYKVTVKPSDGLAEGAESSGVTNFPVEVMTIDNTKCDYDVDISGTSDMQGFNPGIHLENIRASLSISEKPGHSGQWSQQHGSSEMALTIHAGSTQKLYAGINPWTSKTAYITGKAEGSITLTLTPH